MTATRTKHRALLKTPASNFLKEYEQHGSEVQRLTSITSHSSWFMFLTISKNVGIRTSANTRLATKSRVISIIYGENTLTFRFETIGINERTFVKASARSHYPQFHDPTGIPAINRSQFGNGEAVLPNEILFLSPSNL
jgi:hypothetical protein